MPGRLAAVLVAGAMVATSGPAVAQEVRTHVIIVGGIGGEAQYRETFWAWGSTMAKAATTKWGVPRADVTFLTEAPDRDPSVTSGRSTKEEVGKAFARVAASAGPRDIVFILLIGHGSFQNGESHLSLPGPDLSALDFAALVSGFGNRRVVLANVASASGEFVKAISGPNRIVITATKSGMERNQAKFGRYFVEAFAGDGADTDKDGAVSILEAFEFAHRETLRAYEADKTILTEHAVLDDDGDGKGSSEFGPEAADGRIAKATFLGSGAVAAGVQAPPGASPALRALYEQKQAIERSITELRALKDTMDPERYQSELEKLLIDLALKTQEIRKLEGGGP